MTKLTRKIKRFFKRFKSSRWIGYVLVLTTCIRLAIAPAAWAAVSAADYNKIALTADAASVAEVQEDDKSVVMNDLFVIPSFISNYFSKDKAKPAPAKEEVKTIAKGKVKVTAYTSAVEETDDSPFISANGSYVYDGMIACNFLPFGTKVKFPDYSGDKIYVVEDRMNKKHNDKMDIWMETKTQAFKFGIRTLAYEVVQ